MRQKRKPYRGRDDDVLGDEFAEVNERLDELTRHIKHLAEAGLGRRSGAGETGQASGAGVAAALARLDRRLDQVISGAPVVPHEPARSVSATAPAPRFAVSSRIPADWAVQISTRQRELDGEPMPVPQTPGSGCDLAGLEQQLHNISSQITSLQHPYEETFAGLRHEVAEVGRAVTERGPCRAVEAIEAKVESLTKRYVPSESTSPALARLEHRIAALLERLDNTGGPLGRLGAIERGLADLLSQIESRRGLAPHEAPAAPPIGASLEAPVGPPGPVSAPLVEIPSETHHQAPSAPVALQNDPISSEPPVKKPTETAASSPPPAPTFTAVAPPIGPASPAVTEAPRPPTLTNGRPRPEPRRPIDPALPPDTPIEPGTSMPRVRSSSAAARIAASEAILGGPRPMPEEVNIKLAAIAAARNAIKSAALDAPAKASQTAASASLRPFRWSRKARKIESAPPDASAPARETPQPARNEGMEQTGRSGNRVAKRLKALLIAGSVAIIVLGAVQIGLDLLLPGDDMAPAAPPDAPASSSPATTQALPASDFERAPTVPDPPDDSETTGAIHESPSIFDPPHPVAPKPPPAEVTGAITRPPGARPATPSLPAPAPPEAAGSALHVAIAAHDPAAEYEMGSRHAEGRGVPQNLPEAARWLERAANAGFAPAQFRLAGLNEKGEGVKKDVQAARRLYLAAANKGHAKAMHNLAVLHAEGVEGKPDYKVAAQWFRKAAAYGIADSQYNMAILYARGIGVEANLAESYKWFALAAGRGDRDAAKKRDEVAARLDPQTLMAAKLAVQTFVAEREPDEATNLRTPAAGWDKPSAQPAKPRPRAAASPAR